MFNDETIIEREVIYWQGFIDSNNHYVCSPSFLSIKDLKNKNLKNDINNIYKFADDFLDNTPLCGTNKKSFEDSFKNFSFWHYHIGDPYNDYFAFYHGKKCFKDFKINNENACNKCKSLEYKIGIESKKIIYYVKFSENIIGIIGYGLEHKPFPKLNDITEEEYNKEKQSIDYLSNIQFLEKLKIFKDIILTTLEKIVYFLENNSFYNSLYCVHINNAFFLDFLETVKLLSEKNNYIIVSSKNKLTTGESPMLYLKYNEKQSTELISHLIKNNIIDSFYKNYQEVTEIYFVPYSSNILIIESEPWFLDYMCHLININKSEKIIEYYEKYKEIHSDKYFYEVLIN